MTSSSELAERYRAVLPSFVSPMYAEPISIDHGEGSYVVDLEGNRYLDFFGGVLTTMIGHTNPDVVAAVQAQAAKVMHTSTLYLVGADDRARRGDRRRLRASPMPGCSSPRRAPKPTTPRSCSPPRTASPTRCWRCATATTAGRSRPRRSPSHSVVVVHEPLRADGQLRAGRLPAAQPVPRARRRRPTPRRVSTTSSRCST